MKSHLLALVAVALIGAGFLTAWELYRPKPAKPEPPAAAVREKDGSLELQRVATEKLGAPGAIKPAQLIPKGAKVERIEEVTVNPTEKPSSGLNLGAVSEGKPTPSGPGDRSPAASLQAGCPPITVDLTLVRMPDKSQRVLASSPDGSVVGGIDVPVEIPAPFKVQRWTAEALAGYDTHAGRNAFGGEVSYAKGPFVVSGGILGGTGFVGAGIRF